MYPIINATRLQTLPQVGLMAVLPSDHIVLKRCPNLALISDTPKGRGVFATAHISAGTVIDTCPVLLLGVEENKEHIEKTSLYHYTYNWPTADSAGSKVTGQAVIFGLGSMFNHSRDQNVGWKRDEQRQLITYTALRDIATGEELCISYGDRLTFVDADGTSTVTADAGEHLGGIQI